jgi:hypothetical protein
METTAVPNHSRAPVTRRRTLRGRWRPWALAALLAGMLLHLAYLPARRHMPGCARFLPVAGGPMLIAHAAGGLPDRTYANSIAALDLSYGHGLRTFEMDFHELPFGMVRAGHDNFDLMDPRGANFSGVATWLRAHRDATLITDFKTDNVSGLARVAAMAPDLRRQITPFIYGVREYAPVRALGFDHLIFGAFATTDREWLGFVNSHALAGVAVSEAQEPLIPRIGPHIVLHTIDTPTTLKGVDAVVTNCMVPSPARLPKRGPGGAGTSA